MMDINVKLLQWFITFFDRKTSATHARSEALATQNKVAGRAIKNEIMTNKELAEELHKAIIRKFEKSKVHSSFIDNIWGADLAEMQLLSKFNIGIRFLLFVKAVNFTIGQCNHAYKKIYRNVFNT